MTSTAVAPQGPQLPMLIGLWCQMPEPLKEPAEPGSGNETLRIMASPVIRYTYRLGRFLPLALALFAKHIEQCATWVVDIAHLLHQGALHYFAPASTSVPPGPKSQAKRQGNQHQKIPPQTDSQHIILSVWKLENPKFCGFNSIPTAIFQIMAAKD